jgi:hypothetical protein
MIRVSIETSDIYRYRLKPIVDLRQRFLDDGVLVDFDLKNPDLRLLHQDIAIGELERNPDQRLPTPTIVDERVDGAQIINNARVRSALAHPDVKFWLKRNTFRDYRLNNGSFLAGRYHYRLLNEIPEFHIDVREDPSEMTITEEMASKIRLLPTASIDKFAYFREQKIDWRDKRPIDVMFAGLVDYEVRGSDFWDGKYAEAQAATITGVESLPDLHRRAAVQQLTRIRHLRVLIGQNRALQEDIYRLAMLRSSISVSPWGFGEYGYRDYESILSGCVLVKPATDYVETFAPDIYQSDKYYIPCRPDFADLPEIIERIMSDRERAIEIARRAREDMLAANSPIRVHAYYSRLFRQALGENSVEPVLDDVTYRAPVLGLEQGRIFPTRAEISHRPLAIPSLGVKTVIELTEDQSTRNSHDIRLVKDDPTPAGLYRLRFAARKRGRKRMAVHIHQAWQDGVWLSIDLDAAEVEHVKVTGSLFNAVYGPELAMTADEWVVGTLVVHLTEIVNSGLFLVLYGADERSSTGYDGDGRTALDIAVLDLSRVDMRRI